MSTDFTDDFNRADAANLGANYTSLAASYTIVSNQAAAPATVAADYRNDVTPGAACWWQVTAAVRGTAPDGQSVLFRLDTATFNGYYTGWDTAGCTVYRIDGGVPTAIGAAAFTPPGASAVIRGEMHGSSIRLYYNGALVETRTDATYSAAGRVALGGVGTTTRLDDFSGGTLPTLSSPTPSGTLGTSTTATIGCTTDESAGTLYVVVDTGAVGGGADPFANIVAGLNSAGAAADAAGSGTVSSTTPSVGVTGLAPSTAYNYAILQVSGGNSNIVTGTFTTAAGASPPVITVQPTGQTAADGATAAFSATATGATSYQWETQAPGGGSWANVSGGSGATTDTYTTGTLSRSSDAGRLYRLKATNAGGDTYTSPALLRVTQVPATYTGAVGQVIGSSLSWVGHSYVGANDAAPGAFSPVFAARANTVITGGGP